MDSKVRFYWFDYILKQHSLNGLYYRNCLGGAWPHDATKAGAVVEYSAAVVSGQRVSA